MTFNYTGKWQLRSEETTKTVRITGLGSDDYHLIYNEGEPNEEVEIIRILKSNQKHSLLRIKRNGTEHQYDIYNENSNYFHFSNNHFTRLQ